MLSGGEQQRTAIARALASDAKFLLADEPTGNLDVENSQKIMDIFRKLVEEDYCIVVVTHDREIARQADVVYEIVDGRLCFKEIKMCDFSISNAFWIIEKKFCRNFGRKICLTV